MNHFKLSGLQSQHIYFAHKSAIGAICVATACFCSSDISKITSDTKRLRMQELKHTKENRCKSIYLNIWKGLLIIWQKNECINYGPSLFVSDPTCKHIGSHHSSPYKKKQDEWAKNQWVFLDYQGNETSGQAVTQKSRETCRKTE